jgi:hypothetical protein
MGMQKDRKIEIAWDRRRSTEKIDGSRLSLMESFFGDPSTIVDLIHGGERIDEGPSPSRIPSGAKDGKEPVYLDQLKSFRNRDDVKAMKPNSTITIDKIIRPFNAPAENVHVAKNVKGVIRAYDRQDIAQTNTKAKGMKDDKVYDDADLFPQLKGQEPTTDAEPQGSERDADVDAQNASDAAARQAAEEERLSRLETQTDDEGEEQDDGEPEGGGRDADVDAQNAADAATRQAAEEERLSRLETQTDDEGGEQGGGEGGGEPPGDDVIDEPEPQGGAQPPATDDVESVKNYIDQVARGTETVKLSERRVPMHMRSLVELLYSTRLS